MYKGMSEGLNFKNVITWKQIEIIEKNSLQF